MRMANAMVWTQTPKYCISLCLYLCHQCLHSSLTLTVTCIYRRTCVNNSKKCLNSFFAICSQHVTMMNTYSSMDAAIILYIWLVTAVCRYIFKHCWLMTPSWKNVFGVLESPGIFCNQECGNPGHNNFIIKLHLPQEFQCTNNHISEMCQYYAVNR